MLFNLQAVQESFNQNKTAELEEDIKQVSTNLIYELRPVNVIEIYEDTILF